MMPDLLYRLGLILSSDGNNSELNIEHIRETLLTLSSLFSSESLARVFVYLCHQRCCTALMIQMETRLPESTVYRALRRLRSLALIEPAYRIPLRNLSRGGPRPTIWGLKGSYKPEDVARCIQIHRRLLSPKYRLAENIAQRILDSYLNPQNLREISYRTITLIIKELRIPFNIYDIAHLAANSLSERGVKVWR